MRYVLRRTPAFRRAFEGLTHEQKAAALAAFPIFKANPFDPRLRPHLIKRLCAKYRCQVVSIVIGPDLRVVFTVHGKTVHSLDIGTHAIYK